MSEPVTPYHPDDPAHRSAPPIDEPTLSREPLDQAEALDDDWVDEYEEQLPHRPRRRLVTPFNLSLLGVLLVAGGFIGGVLVEKGQKSSTTSAAAGVAALARRAGAAGTGAAGTSAASGTTGAGAGAARSLFGGAGGASANATTGTVTLNDHGTLYITDSEGNTIKVIEASGGTVTRTAVSSVSAIHPGDTVIVSGPKASSGTVTATSIRATAANAASSGFGALFGGGSSSSSTSSGAGGSSSATPSLFGSG